MKTRRMVIIIVSNAVIVWAVLISLLLIYFNNPPYSIHYPAYLRQCTFAFKDNKSNVYFKDWRLRMFRSQGVAPGSYSDNFENISFYHDKEELSIEDVEYNDEMVFVTGFVSLPGPKIDYYIQVYNHDFLLIEELELHEIAVIDLALSEDAIFASVVQKGKEESADVFAWDINDYSSIDKILGVQKNSVINLSGHNLYLNSKYKIMVMDGDKKMLLSSYTEMRVLHKTCFEFDAYINDDNELVVNGNRLLDVKKIPLDEMYSNAYLLNDKVVFAAFRRLNNDNCGADPNHSTCLCRYGKSYLFEYDLQEKSLSIIRDFAEYTFLINYDFNEIEYYYEGAIYINELPIKNCLKIEPGEVKKSHSRYYGLSVYKYLFYISYYNENFYGL